MDIFFVNKLLKIFLFLILFISYRQYRNHKEVDKGMWVVLTFQGLEIRHNIIKCRIFV